MCILRGKRAMAFEGFSKSVTSRDKELRTPGAPLRCSGLKIRHCHCSGVSTHTHTHTQQVPPLSTILHVLPWLLMNCWQRKETSFPTAVPRASQDEGEMQLPHQAFMQKSSDHSQTWELVAPAMWVPKAGKYSALQVLEEHPRCDRTHLTA